MTIGGTVLFKKSNNKGIEAILLEIFEDSETIIEIFNFKEEKEEKEEKYEKEKYKVTLAAIFKVTIPPKLSSKYFMNLEDIIEAPKVLIIKFLGDINRTELYNEMSIHEHFGSQTNIMPFCPSYIFKQEIKNEYIDMTHLGNSFYKLLEKNSNLEERVVYNEMRKFYKKQDILIMEFLDCVTLFKFNLFNKKNKFKTTYIHNLYGEEIEFYNYKQINTFYTYFLATLMALENYSHGDLHMANVLICSDTKLIPEKKPSMISQLFTALNPPNPPNPPKIPTIIPQLIDFGRAALIDRLEFQLLNLEDHITYFSKWKQWADSKNQFNFIKNIYNEANENRYRIVNFIKEKITESKYIESILLMSMCLAINKFDRYYNSNKTSLFNFTFMKKTYNYNGYLHLYKIDESDAKRYNNLIQKLIDKRTIQEQQLKKLMTPYKTSPISHSLKASSRKSPKASPSKASPSKSAPRAASRKSPKASPSKASPSKASPSKASPSKASSKASPKASSSKVSFRTSLTKLLSSLKLPARTVRVGGIRNSKGNNTRKKKH